MNYKGTFVTAWTAAHIPQPPLHVLQPSPHDCHKTHQVTQKVGLCVHTHHGGKRCTAPEMMKTNGEPHLGLRGRTGLDTECNNETWRARVVVLLLLRLSQLKSKSLGLEVWLLVLFCDMWPLTFRSRKWTLSAPKEPSKVGHGWNLYVVDTLTPVALYQEMVKVTRLWTTGVFLYANCEAVLALTHPNLVYYYHW